MMRRPIPALFLTACLVAGCSSDATEDSDFGGATDGSGAGNDGAAMPGTGGQATGLTGAESGGGDETGGADDDGPPGGQPPRDAACPLDCGGLGICVLDKDDLASCDCDNGTAAVGSSCLPCDSVAGPTALNIPVQPLTLDATLNGEPFPTSAYEDGHFALVERNRGDEVVIGNSHDGVLTTSALPGDYELVWRYESGNLIVPENRNAVLGRVGIDPNGGLRLPESSKFSLDETGALVVHVQSTQLSGPITFNGAAPPDSEYEHGHLVLLDPASGDEVVLGDSADGNYSAHVLPGKYEIHYRGLIADDLAPRNNDAFIREVEVSLSDSTLDLEVPMVNVEGAFTLNGAAAPTSEYERGELMLRDLATGDEISLGHTSDVEFSVPVIPGSYELVYRYLQGNLQVPRNHRAVVRTIVVNANETTQGIDVDIPAQTVTGAITVGGGIPPTDPANAGELSLRSLDSDDEVVLGSTTPGSYEAIVIPGNFEIIYGQTTSSGLVPANTAASLRTVDMNQGQVPGAIDVPMSPVSGDVLLNGATPPGSEYDDGRIYLRNTDSGDSVLLGNTRLGSVDSLVVPGMYDVYYVVETPGLVVPQNSGAYLDTVVVTQGVPLDLPLDIPVYDLAGVVTVNDAAPPIADTERANLVLEDASGQDVLFLGEVSAGAFDVPVTAGTYVLYYEMLQTSGALPANQRAGLACYVLGD